MAQPVTVFGTQHSVPSPGPVETLQGFYPGRFLAALAQDGAIVALTASTFTCSGVQVGNTASDAGTVYTNHGAAATVTVTLPSGTANAAGVTYTFIATDAHNFVVTAGSGKLNASGHLAATTCTLTQGQTCAVVCCGGTDTWFCTSATGTFA